MAQVFYTRAFMALMAILIASFVFLVYSVMVWFDTRSTDMLIVAIICLVALAVSGFILLRELRSIYSEPESDLREERIYSHEDCEELHYEITGLPPRK